MAYSSKKGTPRKGTPRSAAAPSMPRVSAPRAPKAPRAPRAPRAPKASRAPLAPRAPKAPRAAKPAFQMPGHRAAAPKAPAAGAVPAFLGRAAQQAGSAAAAPLSGRERREQHQQADRVKLIGGAVVAVCAVGLAVLIAFFVLRDSAIFSVDNVVVEGTTHVSESDVRNLLSLEDGTTLLNIDKDQINDQLKRDPWVASVEVERQFPHTVKLAVVEQQVDMLVVMNSGSLGWYLGSSGSWIEPTKIEASEGQSVNDAALAKARAEGVVLVTGVPATVNPASAQPATDDVLTAVKSFREGFSSEFAAQVVSYDASSTDAISCVLESGVQISLGSATSISYKEQVASALLEKYPGQITYINVRKPASASVRKVGSVDVTQGTGADGGSSQQGQQGSGDGGGDGSGDGGGSDDSGTGTAASSTGDSAEPQAVGEGSAAAAGGAE